MNSSVGFGATSILEELTRDYIAAHTIKGKYVGELSYLFTLQRLISYNKGAI